MTMHNNTPVTLSIYPDVTQNKVDPELPLEGSEFLGRTVETSKSFKHLKSPLVQPTIISSSYGSIQNKVGSKRSVSNLSKENKCSRGTKVVIIVASAAFIVLVLYLCFTVSCIGIQQSKLKAKLCNKFDYNSS